MANLQHNKDYMIGREKYQHIPGYKSLRLSTSLSSPASLDLSSYDMSDSVRFFRPRLTTNFVPDFWQSSPDNKHVYIDLCIQTGLDFI